MKDNTTIPIAPVLSSHFFGRKNNTRDKKSTLAEISILALKTKKLVPSGRLAIAQVLKINNVNSDHEVLLPAFHCVSMVDPVRWLGAKPVFYKINADLTPDLEDLSAKISNQTRAILAVHYYGVVNDFVDLAAICQQHNIILIEDCAHSFYGVSHGQAVGSIGDYAIASPRKFFPLFDGGMVASAKHPLDTMHLHTLGKKYNAKSILDVLEIATTYNRMRGIKPLFNLKRALNNKRSTSVSGKTPTKLATDTVSSTNESEYYDDRFIEASMNGKMSAGAQWMFNKINLPRVAQQRRYHYATLLHAFQNLKLAKPFYQSLPASSVPYIFPLQIENPEENHANLKRIGVPMWRWEVLESTDCEISNDYSKSIIQLPCHQELSNDELDRLISKVQSILQ